MTTTAATAEITPAKRAQMDAANERRRAARAAKRAAAGVTAESPNAKALERIRDAAGLTTPEPTPAPALTLVPDLEPATEPVKATKTAKAKTPKAKVEKPTADPAIVELAEKLTKGDTVEIVYSGGLGVTLGKTYTAQFRALYPKGIVVKILNAEGKPVQDVVRRLERVASLKRA